jgi:hypothetical protein
MAFLRFRTASPSVPTQNETLAGGLSSEQIDGNFKSLEDAKLEKSGGTVTGDLTTKTVNASIVTLSSNVGTINCSLGSYFIQTISSNTTYSFTNVPSSVAYGMILEVNHTGGTITWPSSVKWPNDVAPIISTGKTHVFILLTDDGGTRWRGSSLANYTT